MIRIIKPKDFTSRHKTSERGIKYYICNRADMFFFFIVMLAFMTAAIFSLGISAGSAIRYALCTIFFVTLPGFAVQILVGKARENILLGFAIGYAINVVEYIIIWGLNMQNHAFALAVLFTISLMFLAIRKLKRIGADVLFKSNRTECDARVNIIDFAVIFSVCLIISYVLYSCRYVSPIVTGRRNDIGRDIQYWCSNAVALKLHFPPVASYFYGARLFHHYFSCIHIAFFSQISGLSVFDLAFPLYSFERAALFSGAVLHLVKNQKRWVRWVVYGLFFITTGYESLSYVTYLSHTVTSPFGCDIGFFFGIYFVGFLIEQAESKQFKTEFFIPITLFWMMCVGSKQPIAMVLLPFAFVIVLNWIIKKRYIDALAYGFMGCSVFMSIAVFCTGMFRFILGNY